MAVPPDPEGKGVKLEDCLEDYFNTTVDVSRDNFEEKGSDDRPLLSPRSTIRVVHNSAEEEAEAEDYVDGTPLQRRWTTADTPEPSSSSIDTERPSARHRSTSIIQRIVLDDEGKPTDSDASSLLQKAKKKGSTVVKAVTIPAWQFFRLIRMYHRLISAFCDLHAHANLVLA